MVLASPIHAFLSRPCASQASLLATSFFTAHALPSRQSNLLKALPPCHQEDCRACSSSSRCALQRHHTCPHMHEAKEQLLTCLGFLLLLFIIGPATAACRRSLAFPIAWTGGFCVDLQLRVQVLDALWRDADGVHVTALVILLVSIIIRIWPAAQHLWLVAESSRHRPMLTRPHVPAKQSANSSRGLHKAPSTNFKTEFYPCHQLTCGCLFGVCMKQIPAWTTSFVSA